MDLSQRILDFWFGPPESPDYGAHRAVWFEADDAFDAAVAEQFREDFDRALRGELDGMAEEPAGCLALIILLDQFSRNMFRGSAQSFSADEKARALARGAVEQGLDQLLPRFQRVFVYLPFEHSEAIADQNLSVVLFEALGDEQSLDYAVRHREIIARFGRFPHRNEILGRESTPEEAAFLQEPGSSFGGKNDG
ncbi:MAG: DUF924 domain-containing protein [Alphaproteobacteria bacterium]|nr:DUF924 domain-containing protein [Alphaproteobacteria bacterium]